RRDDSCPDPRVPPGRARFGQVNPRLPGWLRHAVAVRLDPVAVITTDGLGLGLGEVGLGSGDGRTVGIEHTGKHALAGPTTLLARRSSITSRTRRVSRFDTCSAYAANTPNEYRSAQKQTTAPPRSGPSSGSHPSSTPGCWS